MVFPGVMYGCELDMCEESQRNYKKQSQGYFLECRVGYEILKTYEGGSDAS